MFAETDDLADLARRPVAARLPFQLAGLGECAHGLFQEQRIALAGIRDGAAQPLDARVAANQIVEKRCCFEPH